MLHEIGRFEPFRGLSRNTLLAVSRHARLVDVPAGRWLVRRGRSLGGTHFLVHGTVKTLDPDGLVHSGQAAARNAVYPGVAGLRTVTDCRLLQLPDSGLELLRAAPEAGFATLLDVDDCWQTRFLSSHLMTSLPLVLWQQTLSRLEATVVESGAWILAEGAAENLDLCYILASGRAEVVQKRQRLCLLNPGDLFGEDALISALPRNASVRMIESGEVMAFRAVHFREFLVSVFESGTFAEPADTRYSNAIRQNLSIGNVTGLRDKIAALDDCVTYLVSCPVDSICALALFLMRKRGLRAWSAPSS